MATEKRLIPLSKRIVYAGDVFNSLMAEKKWSATEASDFMKEFATVNAVEVVHGEWSTIEDDYCGMTALHCSECNQEYWFEDEPPTKIYNYCPNCGAKMDGDGNG